MRIADKAAAWLACVLGVAHLVVGHAAFLAPTERRIWFASAGFLLVVTGLANLAAQGRATRMQNAAAAVGSASILTIGALLAVADPALLAAPQTVLLLALGGLLTALRVRGMLARDEPRPGE